MSKNINVNKRAFCLKRSLLIFCDFYIFLNSIQTTSHPTNSPVETTFSNLFHHTSNIRSLRADQLTLIFHPISFLQCFYFLLSTLEQPYSKLFHWRSGYESIPRSSLDAARRTDWTFTRLRHKTDLCACLMLVCLLTWLGLPMKSSCCWHANAKGLKTHGLTSARSPSSIAVWHSMCNFGYIGKRRNDSSMVKFASNE